MKGKVRKFLSKNTKFSFNPGINKGKTWMSFVCGETVMKVNA